MTTLENGLRRLSHCIAKLPGGKLLIKPIRACFAKHYRLQGNTTALLSDFDEDLFLQVDRSSYIGGAIYWHGYHSHTKLACLDGLLKPDMVFADIGANQGELTLFAARRLTEGRVISFELQPLNYKRLEENVRLNGFTNVTTHNFGPFSKPGNLPLYTSDDFARSFRMYGGIHEGLPTLYPTIDRNKPDCPVRVQTFDTGLNDCHLNRSDGMKIDVEGAELPVREAATNAI